MPRLLVVLLAAVIAFASPALAQSTVNPLVPAQNAPLASAPVRSNFAAAASDINGLLGMHAVSSLGSCSVQTQTIGADCLVEQSASNYIWYKYAGAQGYVAIGTINPSVNPPTFTPGYAPIGNGHLVANCSGATAIPGNCAWTTYADQAIGATNGDLPLRISGTWSAATVGTSGHAIPFLDGSGLVFSNPITSGVVGLVVGGYCLANATSGNICLVPQVGALGTSVATFPANSGVVAELNAVQVFTARQTVNLNTVTLPSPLTGTMLNVGQTDGTISRVQLTSFGAGSVVSAVAYGGTNSVPTAVTSGTEIGSFNSWVYNGSALSGTAIAAFRTYAAENIASGHQGSKTCLATTPLASTTLADGLCQQPSGGVTVGVPTGTDEGLGTLNLAGSLYNNGTGPTGSGGYVLSIAPTITNASLVTPSLGVASATSLTLGTALTVPNGGTGATSFTAHGVILGEGTAALSVLAGNSGNSSLPLVSQGASLDPTYSQIGLSAISGLGTGVASALAVNVGSAGAPVLFNGAGGTPGSITLTNASGLPLSALPSGTSDTVLGYWGSTAVGTTAVNNCANALTYSTSTHTFGCNSTAGTGTVTTTGSPTANQVATFSAPTVIQGVNLASILTQGAGVSITGTTSPTIALALNNATLQASPSNPTGATTTTVMMGFGVATCRITPVYSSRMHVSIQGYLNDATTGAAINVQARYGTGSGPANGSASTGTGVGSTVTATVVAGGAIDIPFKLGGVITGLTPGTAVWLDLAISATSGTGTPLGASCDAFEF